MYEPRGGSAALAYLLSFDFARLARRGRLGRLGPLGRLGRLDGNRTGLAKSRARVGPAGLKLTFKLASAASAASAALPVAAAVT